MTWIYNNTQSVFWIILMHGWNNTIQWYLVLSAGFVANVIFAVLLWGVAIYLSQEVRQPDLAGRTGGDICETEQRLTLGLRVASLPSVSDQRTPSCALCSCPQRDWDTFIP